MTSDRPGPDPQPVVLHDAALAGRRQHPLLSLCAASSKDGAVLDALICLSTPQALQRTTSLHTQDLADPLHMATARLLLKDLSRARGEVDVMQVQPCCERRGMCQIACCLACAWQAGATRSFQHSCMVHASARQAPPAAGGLRQEHAAWFCETAGKADYTQCAWGSICSCCLAGVLFDVQPL